MQFPENLKNNINFINTLDSSKDSLGFNSNQKLVRRNYSCLRNFFRWFIHFITFKSRPLNEELDKAFSYFAKEVKKIKNQQMTQEEITSLKRAIETLETIISKNGGSKKEKIKNLIAIVNKIETSDAIDVLRKKDNKESPQDRVKELFFEAKGHPDKNTRETALKYLVQLIEKEELFNFEAIDIYISLLPLFNDQYKRQLLTKVLERLLAHLKVEEQKPIDKFLIQAEKLPIKIWEEASKELKNIDQMERLFTSLRPAQCAAFVQGQKHNEDFLFKFFMLHFKAEQNPYRQQRIQYLEPKLFEMSDLNKIPKELWLRFYQLLDENKENEKVQKLLIASTINLLKEDQPLRSEVFLALTEEQIRLLPIEKYPPGVSLMLAYRTNQFDHPHIKEIVSNFKEKEDQDFLKLFRTLYMNPQDLIDLIMELKELNEAAHLIDACITAICEKEEDKSLVIKKLPVEILEKHVIPKIAIF